MSVEPGRIEMRFSGAKDAGGRLFALAQALTTSVGGRPVVRTGAAGGP